MSVQMSGRENGEQGVLQLEKRELIAAMMLQAVVTSSGARGNGPVAMAAWAVQLADALLVELAT